MTLRGQLPVVSGQRRGPRVVVAPVVCCVDNCGNAAEHGSFCRDCWLQYTALSEQWNRQDRLLRDPAFINRCARQNRFFGVLMAMFLGEGITNWAWRVPISFRWLAISVGWALAVAIFAMLFCGKGRIRIPRRSPAREAAVSADPGSGDSVHCSPRNEVRL